jgi:hypothetical protein
MRDIDMNSSSSSFSSSLTDIQEEKPSNYGLQYKKLHTAVVRFNAACDQKRREFADDVANLDDTPLKLNKHKKNSILKALKADMQIFERNCLLLSSAPDDDERVNLIDQHDMEDDFHDHIHALYAAHLDLLKITHVGRANKIASFSVSKTAQLVGDFIKEFHTIAPEEANADYNAVVAIYFRAQKFLREIDQHKDKLQDELNANTSDKVSNNKATKISIVNRITETVNDMIEFLIPNDGNSEENDEILEYSDILIKVNQTMPGINTAIADLRLIPHVGWMSLFSSVMTTPDSKTTGCLVSLYKDLENILVHHASKVDETQENAVRMSAV